MGMISTEAGSDKRQRNIMITEDGITLLQKALPLWQKAQDEVVAAMGPQKWQGLLLGLHSLAKTL